MATTDDELVVYHSADEFEWYDNLDVDEEGGANGDGEYRSGDSDGIYSDVCEDGINDDGESDGDDGDGESDDGGSDDGGSDSDKDCDGSDCDGDSGSDCDGDGDDVSKGPGGVPARIARGQCRPRRMLNAYLTKGGCCKDGCLLKYGDLPKRRALTLSRLDKKTRKAVVYGMLAVTRNKSGSRNTFQYRLDWSSPVCRDAFCAVIGTSYCTLKRWQQQVCSDSDVEPHPHGNCGRALSREDKRMVVRFIENYAATNALPDPGRLQGTIRDYVLESGKTLKSMYAEYCKAKESLSKTTPAPQQPCPYKLTTRLKRQYTLLNVPPAPPTPPAARVVKYVSFIRLWRRYCFNIKIQPARSDLCDKCDQMLVTLRHSLSDEQRKTINDKYNQHLIKAKAFRDAYNANIEEAEKEWGSKGQKERDQILGHLESRALMAPFTSHAHLDMQMQYSFDYCQQVSLPYSSQQRGTFYFRTPRKVQVFGVCCEPLCRQVFFLIDEAEQAGKGAVVVVSLVHAFFHLHGLGERRVTLQADNCVGQNKNTTMMWYLAWRVITGQHNAIQLNFMLPGHTKFRPDSYFGLFKKYYRRQDHVDDMDDLADCVRHCGQNVTCVPQLYQNWQYYDWNTFLGQWFTPLAGLGRYHTFEFGSGSALSLHKKMTHKQPAVPGDEHSGATKVDSASVDVGSQDPSKRRHRKKSEIDRPFSCFVWGNKYGSSSALYTHKKRDHGS